MAKKAVQIELKKSTFIGIFTSSLEAVKLKDAINLKDAPQ
jgi:hypothetical protein